MTDILLSHGYFLYEDPKELEIMKPYPTLGLLYISAYLKNAGFSVELFDTTFAERQSLYDRFKHDSSGVLGLYVNLMTRQPILDIIEHAKAANWTVVLGGPEAANYPDEYLQAGADVVVIGEGEQTMAELLPAIDKQGVHRLDGVNGIVFYDEEGSIKRTAARSNIADIDSIPWPDREQIDISRYVDVWREHHGMGSINLITARGCPYKCKWCSHAVFGYSHRRRHFKNCADEVEFLVKTYSPDQIWYADDVFTISNPWLYNYAEELKRRKIHLPFETISRADRMTNEKVIKTLAEMGCYRIWIGSESGSQRILDKMERGVTAEQVQWATKTAQKYGIEVGMFLMWGYDGETEEDIAATIEHVKNCNPDIYFTTVSYPIKDTVYYNDLGDKVVTDQNWRDISDRDYKVKGRHSRQYYSFADQWLRNEVDAFRLEICNPASPAEAQIKRQLGSEARNNMRKVEADVEA